MSNIMLCGNNCQLDANIAAYPTFVDKPKAISVKDDHEIIIGTDVEHILFNWHSLSDLTDLIATGLTGLWGTSHPGAKIHTNIPAYAAANKLIKLSDASAIRDYTELYSTLHSDDLYVQGLVKVGLGSKVSRGSGTIGVCPFIGVELIAAFRDYRKAGSPPAFEGFPSLGDFKEIVRTAVNACGVYK